MTLDIDSVRSAPTLPADPLAAEVAAAREVVVELRQLLDRFSTPLGRATRIFDETVV